MMTENNSNFWLLTFDYFKKDIKKSEDNLVVLVHWLLLKNDFRVLGPGNENEIDENEQSTDILPSNWSQETIYKLRYVRDKKLFLLNCVIAGDGLIFNFYSVTTKQVSSAALSSINTIIQWISDVDNNKDDFYKTTSLLQKDLIDPMQKENEDKKVASTQTQSKQPESISECPLLISRTEPNRYIPNVPRNPFPSYGMPDLDPLGNLHNPGGGMIFDPMRVGSRRPEIFQGVPSRARFDPMYPPDPDTMIGGGIRRPNPDHMRPPSYDDDMYI